MAITFYTRTYVIQFELCCYSKLAQCLKVNTTSSGGNLWKLSNIHIAHKCLIKNNVLDGFRLINTQLSSPAWFRPSNTNCNLQYLQHILAWNNKGIVLPGGQTVHFTLHWGTPGSLAFTPGAKTNTPNSQVPLMHVVCTWNHSWQSMYHSQQRHFAADKGDKGSLPTPASHS